MFWLGSDLDLDKLKQLFWGKKEEEPMENKTDENNWMGGREDKPYGLFTDFIDFTTGMISAYEPEDVYIMDKQNPKFFVMHFMYVKDANDFEEYLITRKKWGWFKDLEINKLMGKAVVVDRA